MRKYGRYTGKTDRRALSAIRCEITISFQSYRKSVAISTVLRAKLPVGFHDWFQRTEAVRHFLVISILSFSFLSHGRLLLRLSYNI